MHSITARIPSTASVAEFHRALTTPEGLRGWWARDASVDGPSIHLVFDKGGTKVHMRFRVEQVDDHEVRWTCTENGNPVWPGTTLRWTRSEGAVEFEHAGFAENVSPPFKMTEAGWAPLFDSLEAHLAGRPGAPI